MVTRGNVPIQKVVKFGRCFRHEHLEGKRFVVLALVNAGMGAWCLLVAQFPWKLLAILSLSAAILSIVRFIRDNFITIPDWAKDVWHEQS